MTTPWDRITDDAYRSWLLDTPIAADEYNGASLTDRRKLRTQYVAEQQQQQQPQQVDDSNELLELVREQLLSPEARAGLAAFALDYQAKKRTIVLSDATGSAKNGLLDMLELPETGASWPKRPMNVKAFPGFDWLSSNEDSQENRTAYMAHLTSHLQLPENYSMGDVQPKRDLLTTEIKGMEESRRIRGTTDVVIAKSRNIENNAVRNSVEALLELKKPENMRSKDHNPKVTCEHLAASYLNHKEAVVSVLTDLNNSWTFYWYAENTDGLGVALHKLQLEDQEGAAALARYILESLKDDSRRETLPTTFVDRLSFEDVTEELMKEFNRKRQRRDFGSGGGGSSQTEHEKPAGSRRQPPPPGPGGNSSSGIDFPDIGDAGEGSRATDMARVLCLLAPHFNNDVANELDLLDMVDEAEQYEIVRSFAAKHIVPHMTGKTL